MGAEIQLDTILCAFVLFWFGFLWKFGAHQVNVVTGLHWGSCIQKKCMAVDFVRARLIAPALYSHNAGPSPQHPTKSHNRVVKFTPRWDYQKVHCLEFDHAPCACPGLMFAMRCRCGGEKRGVGARWCTPDLGRAKVG